MSEEHGGQGDHPIKDNNVLVGRFYNPDCTGTDFSEPEKESEDSFLLNHTNIAIRMQHLPSFRYEHGGSRRLR